MVKFLLAIVFSVILLCSCGTTPQEKFIEVAAHDFKFIVADSIQSGWNNFRFNNSGHTEHFFLLNKLPDSISYETYHEKVVRPFEIVFDSLKAGMSKEDAIGLLVSMIPGWYFTDVKSMGGSGIISMGKSTTVSLKLPSGTYAMECYIKEQGVFHTSLGMIKKLVVTDEVSEVQPPTANMELTLTNFKIESQGQLYKGKNTFAVKFNEHPELGLGNDIHIIKLEASSSLDEVITWLDWMNIKGLQSPAPVKFFGGAQEMPVGSTAYFTATLDTGRYAWIAESSAARGMVKEFTIK